MLTWFNWFVAGSDSKPTGNGTFLLTPLFTACSNCCIDSLQKEYVLYMQPVELHLTKSTE